MRTMKTGFAVLTGFVLAATLTAPPAMAESAPTPEAVAAAAADEAMTGAFRVSAAEDFDRVSMTLGGRGVYFVSYERSYEGLRVVGGDAVVAVSVDKDGTGDVRETIASPTAPLKVATTPEVTAKQAHATATAQVSTVDKVATPELLVLAGQTPRLAYEVVVSGTHEGMPTKLHVLVDAVTGDIAQTWDEVMAGTGRGFYNGTVTFNTSQSGGQFRMVDTTRPGLQCGNNNTRQVFSGPDDVWGNASGTNLETACVDAFWAVQRQWDMLRTWLGRNGINGSGRGFPAWVGLNQANAFWNGSSATFGRSSDRQRQATPIDVVAHEFGHGIFQNTPGGSGGGGNEKGGLNESTGDIFGALTEFFANNPNDPPDFLVGEEVNLVGSGPIRNMANPSAEGDPNCWSTSIPNTEVHAAAGPQNHWFVLLAQGSGASPTCNNSTVTGIGVQKAGQVFYNGLLRKTTTWTHALARRATLAAALQLFPGSCTEFNSVRAAWSAVSVPAQSGEPTCTP